MEKELMKLEKGFPRNIQEVTNSYNAIPLHFRQSATLQLQRHIETVINIAELYVKRNPIKDIGIVGHLDAIRVLLGRE